ncbi:MAG: hypothetical protein GWN13_11270 [Phycisphaerae bacterium]|nr:hypothetical protein [Phycisphaerae bacterium]
MTSYGHWLAICGIAILVGCERGWQLEDDRGYYIENVKIEDVSLSCRQGEHGHRETYRVRCDLSWDLIHPVNFTPKKEVLLVPRLVNRDSLTSEERRELLEADYKVPGQSIPDQLGLDHSIIVKTEVYPRFILKIGTQAQGTVRSEIDTSFDITISANKCEIFNIAGSKSYYCFPFGSK